MIDRSRLRQFMIESFNDDELADLVFDYFPNARASLGGTMTLGQKVRTLIDFADRHDRLDHLVIVVEKLRPEAYCNFFQTGIDLPPEPETAARDPNKIFISYANPDVEFAIRLAGDLRQSGFDIWMAPDSILPGEKWVAAIERGLRESGIFLLVLTPAGVDSKWVSQETQVAIMLENEGQMRIYPLRVRRAEVPLLLSTRQHISFDTDYDRGLAGLLAALRPGQKPAAPPISAPLPAPQRPAVTETLLVSAALAPVLIVDWPDAPNQEFALTKSAVTVGRAPDNDIVLNLPIVSSHHLLLETEDMGETTRVWLTDVGSRNGTFLSGRRLPLNTRQPLEPGDVIHLGDRVGRSISLILHPSPTAAPTVATPPVAAHKPPMAALAAAAAHKLPAAARPSPPAANRVAPPAPAPTAPAAGDAAPAGQRGGSGRVPIWAYAAGAVALVALLAFLALRGRGGERPATADASPVATDIVVVAGDESATATEAATETAAEAAAALPTAPPTVAPAATESPAEATATTETPAKVAADEAAADVATATTEPTATPEPTATAEPPALPTLASGFTISLDTPLTFEALGEWQRDAGNSRAAGEAAISSENARGGLYSLRLSYDFPSEGDDYVIFLTPRPIRIDSTGSERIFKVWVLGDGGRINLSAIVEDSEGELWKVFLDEIVGTEWQRLDGYIGDTSWPSGVFLTPRNGELDFPIRLRGFHLDDATASFIGAGAIFLDDITVE